MLLGYLLYPSAAESSRRIAQLESTVKRLNQALEQHLNNPQPAPGDQHGDFSRPMPLPKDQPPRLAPPDGFETLELPASCLEKLAQKRGRSRPFRGGDFETPGVFEAALAARAPDKELIFLSVGDTRDHRRAQKDPKLRSISTDFLRNLLANLKRLDRQHYLILSTKSLCGTLQRVDCELACGWSTLWDDHPGLEPWGIKPGDMFLMWAQQWRYIARAMEMGYRVLRADTDVYFAEDPYPIFNSPLFRDFEMLVQHDFMGSERPKCTLGHRPISDESAFPGGFKTCGLRDQDASLLNIGLVYLRSKPGGGVFASINGTWELFLKTLTSEPVRPPHLGGKVDSQRLIDQPFMRAAVNDLAVADSATKPPKLKRQWVVLTTNGKSEYPDECGVDVPFEACKRAPARASKLRATSAFPVQLVQPRDGIGKTERVALAPDWLFGRGCLTHVEKPAQLLERARPGLRGEWEPKCARAAVAPAPGPAAGILVATHFVYSMAQKRTNAFRAFAWDLADDAHNRSTPNADCFTTAKRGILFGHTFFPQLHRSKSVLCALPDDDMSFSCNCCLGLPSLVEKETRHELPNSLQTTGGNLKVIPTHFANLEGCRDYQMFWD